MKLLNTLATQTYVQQPVANLVNSSPSSVDTLQELATALGNDPNFSTTVTKLIGTKANSNNPTFITGITTPCVTLSGTSTELSYLSGMTSNIQTQLNSKSNATNPIFTGPIVQTITESNNIFIGSATTNDALQGGAIRNTVVGSIA
jgi:hypothetical protein